MGDIFDTLAEKSKGDVFDNLASKEPEDIFDKFAENTPSFMRDVALKTATDIPKKMVSAAEIVANLATQSYGMVVRGYSEMADLATDVFTGKQAGTTREGGFTKKSEALIYNPQTEYGKKDMEAISGLFEWWHNQSVGAGEYVQEKVEPIVGPSAAPSWGATTATLMEASPLLLGEAYGKGKGVVESRRARTLHEELTAKRIKDEASARAEQSRTKAQDLERAYIGEEIPGEARPYEAAWQEVGDKVSGDISRGYVGEEVPNIPPKRTAYEEWVTERTPTADAQWEALGTEVADRIQRGSLGDVVQEGTRRPDIAPEVKEYVGPRPPPPKQLAPPKPVDPGPSIAEVKSKELTKPSEPAERSVFAEKDVPDINTVNSDIKVVKDELVKLREEESVYRRTGEQSLYNADFAFIKEKIRRTSESLDALKKRKEELGGDKPSPLGNTRGSSMLVTDIANAADRAAKRTVEFFAPFSKFGTIGGEAGKRYLELRYRAKGDSARVDRIVKILSDRLKPLDDSAKKDTFNVIRGEIPIDTLSPELQLITKQTIADLDRVGAFLVKEGLLDKATFDAKKGQYIHYMYLRHILPEGTHIPVGNGGRLDLAYLKHRVLDDLKLPKAEIERIRQELGLIEDVSIAAPVGVGKALGDISQNRFFSKIAHDPDFVWQPGNVTIDFTPKGKPVKIGIGKLVEEVRAYEEMIAKGGGTPEVKAKHKQLSDALENAQQILDKNPKDHIMLPTSKNYGELAGQYVRREIANDIMPIFNMSASELEGLATVWNNAGRTLEAGMTMYKAGKVALNPPTVFRNIVSNPFQMNMSGIGAHRMPGVVYDGIKSMLEKDKHYRGFERYGGFKTNFSQSELKEVLARYEKLKGSTTDNFFMGVAELTRYYGKIDDLFKMSLYRDAVTYQGMSPADAAIYAHKWGMDYSLTSRSIKHIRRTVLPMSTYYYKIAPLIAESLVKRPWVIGKWAAVPAILAKYAAEKYNWTDDELDRNLKMMAERTKHQGSYTLLPTKDNRGNIEMVNLEYFVPWGNWLGAARDIKGGDYLDAANQFGGFFGPYGKAMTMIATKKAGKPPVDPFTGQPIYSQLDSQADKYLKSVEWTWQLFGPSAFSSNGALGYTWKAATNQKDRWGTEATAARSLGRWMGVNIGSLDPRQVMATRKAKLKELDLEIHKIQRDPTYSSEKKSGALLKLREERRKIINPQ